MEIKFKFNCQKLIETILYISSKKSLSKSQILNILYQADYNHLNEHARPITGDPYQYSNWGPVGVNAVRLISDPLSFKIVDNKVIGNRAFDRAYFSVSDLEALDNIINNQVETEQKNNLILGKPIKFNKIINNLEVLQYLKENGSFTIVI